MSKTVKEITHFQCGSCAGWWQIENTHEDKAKTTWFCPWCGRKVVFENIYDEIRNDGEV
jgi:ribosomal protein L33